MKRLSALFCLFVALGCGGVLNSSDGGGGGGGTNAMSESLRVTAATAAIDSFVQMAGKSTAEKAVALPAKWKTIPGFSDAGYDAETDTYWAIFNDGVPFMYLGGTAPGRSTAQGRGARAMDQLPIPNKIAIFDSLGNAFGHDLDKVVSAANKHGYSATLSKGTLEELAVVNGVAGLLWQTHGGKGYRAKGFPAKKEEVYGYWTETPMSNAPSAQIAAMIANDELAVGGASVDVIPNPVDQNHNGQIDEDERVTHEGHYLILPKFVQTHMRTGENSFVWVDACSSATDNAMVSAFLDKGADVFLGWDNLTRVSNEATARAFDRMFAENKVNPEDSPPYRPENLFDVVGWLQRMGFDKTTVGQRIATLKYFTRQDENFALLRPTIQHCNVFESTEKGVKATLLITGEFGPERNYPRKVTVDGTEIKINEWTTTLIDCELPDAGAGSYGPVIVHANGHKSNEVPITLWKVKMTYLMDGPGSLFYKWDMDINFRQDVHKARKKPWEIAKGASKRWAPMWDSKATVTAGGQGSFGGGAATWSGGGTPPYDFAVSGTTYFFAIPVNMDTELGKAPNFAFVGSMTGNAHIILPRGPVDEVLPLALATNPFTMELDDTYSIKGKTVALTTSAGVGRLSWGTTGGVWPPDSSTQARPKR